MRTNVLEIGNASPSYTLHILYDGGKIVIDENSVDRYKMVNIKREKEKC